MGLEAPKFFDVSHSNLSYLFSETAIDLDNRIQGIGNETESIRKAGNLIYDLYDRAKKGTIDPAQTTVLTRAIKYENFNSSRIKSHHMDEVTLKLHLLQKDFKGFRTLPTRHLEELRDFCVDLSRSVSAYRSEFYPRRRYLAA